MSVREQPSRGSRFARNGRRGRDLAAARFSATTSSTGSRGRRRKIDQHSDRHPRVDRGGVRPREKRIRHRRADAVRDDGDLRDALRAQERDGGGEPLARGGQRDGVVLARRAGGEHGHLHGQRRVACVGEERAHAADHAEIRMDAEAVDDDHTPLRRADGSVRIARTFARDGVASQTASPTTIEGTTSAAQRSSRASSIAGAASAPAVIMPPARIAIVVRRIDMRHRRVAVRPSGMIPGPPLRSRPRCRIMPGAADVRMAAT